MTYQKPIPLKNIDNAPYWDAADHHELKLQKCSDCSNYNHPPGPGCAKCGSTNLTWENFGGDVEGKVYSYIISYRPFLPGFQNDIPLVIAQVELDNVKDVRIIANIIDCEAKEVEIGKTVKMVWEDITDDRALPQWKIIE
ncbi:Zn-ribbon domain-containing OB-fold protein [Oceanobacillus bengalensis]|uniref:Zn-ribbon domain-containing OB-fold protein n=1 Tax=Oceanobacillus bengalensis TaxID=1435466 RepID=A0A494YTH1_9BACI|nr:OB-fold domain-containing protein [Oceanobacillus bengalensis]RKQ13303.1 hypothetical protein D8M05_16635 [Oceanobacillus bengalensis]